MKNVMALYWAFRRRWLVFSSTWSLRLRLWLYGVKPPARLSSCGRVNLMVHRTARVTLGPDLTINSGFCRNPVGADHVTSIWVGPGASLSIGTGVGLSGCTLTSMQEVAVGDQVLIGAGVCIYDSDFHSLDAIQRNSPRDEPVRNAPVRIEERAFIGAHSMILKGVVVGARSVIGAGSVVTRSIPPDELWAGNPARFIRKL